MSTSATSKAIQRTDGVFRWLLWWMLVSALASPTAAQAAGDELPLVYEGDGLRVLVETLDTETWRMTGTIVLGASRMSYTAKVVETDEGDEVIVGKVETEDGKRSLRVVEESNTVAVVTFGGKTYRTKRVPKDKPEQPVAQPEQERPLLEPAGRVVMKPHTVLDAGMGNMKSHTVLAPSGWKVEGGAWWPAQAFFAILPSQDIIITAPDGREVHIGPNIGATDFIPSSYAVQQLGAQRSQEGSASEGTPVIHMPGSLEEWKTFVAQKAIAATYPKAKSIRVEEVVVVPELTAALQRQLEPFKRQNAEANRQSDAFGGGTHSSTDGSVLGATCSYELEGKKWEQLFVFGTAYMSLETQVGRQLWWSIEPNVSFRAPAGQLEANMPLMLTVSYSMRPTPEWARMKADHARKMNQISAKGAADRARIIADSNREINQMIVEGHRQREAVRDETHRKVINAIRGVEEYTTAGSGTSVQLPNNYSHVYANGNGEYVLTNDANYDPNIDPDWNSTNWTVMQPVKP